MTMAELDRLAAKAQRHAKRCRRCYMPIIDDEGNPGFFGEACRTGAPILRAYVSASDEMIKALGIA